MIPQPFPWTITIMLKRHSSWSQSSSSILEPMFPNHFGHGNQKQRGCGLLPNVVLLSANPARTLVEPSTSYSVLSSDRYDHHRETLILSERLTTGYVGTSPYLLDLEDLCSCDFADHLTQVFYIATYLIQESGGVAVTACTIVLEDDSLATTVHRWDES